MTRPNILLIMTDQQRADCLGVEGHPALLTPNMDRLSATGVRFGHAYSTCPACIPARRSLLSGQFPSTHGLVGFQDGVDWNPRHTLPGVLREAGYHTALVGRPMHQHPRAKRFGYDHMQIADYGATGTREPWRQTGLTANGWTARPWHLDEASHPTNQTAELALDFLEQWRDPSCPFFLTVSFIAPHPPLCPPTFYMERYLRMDLPAPVIGDWAQPPPEGACGFAVTSDRVDLTGEALHSCRAAYYGLINHVDDQLTRILDMANNLGLLHNTVVVFTSDHGEMLGDHYLFRKVYPYEASARVPMIVVPPDGFDGAIEPGSVVDAPVCLEDVMPTVLDIAGVPIPDSVDGRSLAPLMRGQTTGWRGVLHGEHAQTGGAHSANHFLTDGREKYIWFSQTGREQFFDLDDDPDERRDLARRPDRADQVDAWRLRLIEELRDRPEGFTDGERLVAGRPHVPVMPAGDRNPPGRQGDREEGKTRG